MSIKISREEIDAPNFLLSGSEIIERDNNANGEYIRFRDGTLICWKEITRSSFFDITNFEGLDVYWAVTNRYNSGSNVWRTSTGQATAFPATFSSLHVIITSGGRKGHPAGFDTWITTGAGSNLDWSFSIRSGFSQNNNDNNDYFLFAVGRWG